MKTILVLIASLWLFEFITCKSSNDRNLQIDRITLEGGSPSKGRLKAELKPKSSDLSDRDRSTAVESTVCGNIDVSTANLICKNLGFLVTLDYGTVSRLGVPSTSAKDTISDLNCDHATTISECSFSQTSSYTCMPFMETAVSCAVTPVQVVGIVIATVLFCLLLTCIPAMIYCCYILFSPSGGYYRVY